MPRFKPNDSLKLESQSKARYRRQGIEYIADVTLRRNLWAASFPLGQVSSESDHHTSDAKLRSKFNQEHFKFRCSQRIDFI